MEERDKIPPQDPQDSTPEEEEIDSLLVAVWRPPALQAAAAQPALQGSVGLPAAEGEEPTLKKEEEEGEMVNIGSPPLILFCSKQNYINDPFIEVDQLLHLAPGGSVNAVLRVRNQNPACPIMRALKNEGGRVQELTEGWATHIHSPPIP